MRISVKMVLGYFILIVIPFFIFVILMYQQFYEKLATQYRLTNQQHLEQQGANLDANMLKIEAMYSVFQNNSYLLDFLRGNFLNDKEFIYSYLKGVESTLSFATLGEPLIKNSTIYIFHENKIVGLPEFEHYKDMEPKLTQGELDVLSPAKGLWKYEYNQENHSMELRYYHKLYSETYNSELGLLVFDVKGKIIDDFILAIANVHEDSSIVFSDVNQQSYLMKFNEKHTHYFNLDSNKLNMLHSEHNFWYSKHLVLNEIMIPRLNLTIVEINDEQSLLHSLWNNSWWIIVAILLLIALTIFYYILITSLTKRILLLARNMRKVGTDFIGSSFVGKQGKDEIGDLISNYNAMIRRIDELVNKVQKVELLKKEADFKMLQAQIQPHFLYNTLETMRMLARSNKDYQVAEMAYSLGKLLRYSLTKTNDTTLREEIDHVKEYIAIHQIRMNELSILIQNNLPDALLDFRCPRFILQPIVENSLLHGLSDRRGKKEIHLSFLLEQEQIRIVIADNGKGLTEQQAYDLRYRLTGHMYEHQYRNKAGIGLSNVYERVMDYYEQRAKLGIESRQNIGTTITLIIPLGEIHHAKANDS